MSGLTQRRHVDAAFCLSRVSECETSACPNQVWILCTDRWCQCDAVLCPLHRTHTWTLHPGYSVPQLLGLYTIQQWMQWNNREANHMFTQITNPTGEQICFCDTKWPLAKLLIFVSFLLLFSNVRCGSHFYFRISVLVLCEDYGWWYFQSRIFQEQTWSKYWLNGDVDKKVENKIPAQQMPSVSDGSSLTFTLVTTVSASHISALHFHFQHLPT